MADLIGCVEAAYEISGDEATWLRGLAQRSAGLFRFGLPPLAFSFDYGDGHLSFGPMATAGPALLIEWARRLHAVASPEATRRVYGSGEPIGCLSEQVFRQWPQQQAAALEATGGLVRDVVGLTAHTGTGRGVSIGVALPCASPPRPADRRRWPLLASHVAAGLRLRRALQQQAEAPPRDEAVLDPGGRLLHAAPASPAADARELLRDAVRRIDAARTRAGRRDPDTALAAWEALVAGRWSLVDRFDSDGHRYVVAMRNDPGHGDPRGLSPREHQVAGLIGLGQGPQAVAYALGLSPSTVAQAADSAQAKLGLTSRMELAAFFAPTGPRTRLRAIEVAGQPLLVGAWPQADSAAWQPLSAAEREVATLLLAGSTLADVAQRRGSSVRTVANQVQSIHRKLGVRSRLEMAAVLMAPPPA